MLRHRLFALLVWASAAATAFVGSGQHMAAETAATVSSALTTQEARPGASPGLVEARRAFDAAGAKGDKAAYARYLAEDVTWITRSGRLQDKASLVDGLRATTPSSTPAVDIRPYPGGAVVVGTRNGNIRYLQVWVQKAGQWQMAAHHGATIEGANPPAGPITGAQNSSKSPASVGAAADLEAIVKAFDAVTANNARGDAAGFGRLVTEGFVAIGTDGKLLTRDERMRQIGSSPPPATPIPSGAREDASTRVHGDIAVSTFVPPAAAGRPRLRQTVVHVRQGGAWRRAAIASTVVQSGK